MDADPSPTDEESPGKQRTFWHPILVALLEWALRDSCEVREEVSVGRMPLRLDVVLIRLLENPLPSQAIEGLSAISRRLNAYTLIEFKSPTDKLEFGDWNRLLGCADLFLAQSEVTIRSADLTLIVLAPSLTLSFAEELAANGSEIRQEESGIHQITGGAFEAFVIETDLLAGATEPALTLVSHEFLLNPRKFIAELLGKYGEMVRFAIQQIEQLRGKNILLLEDVMAQRIFKTLDEMDAEWLERMPVEKRLHGIPFDERLKGMPTKERVKGIPSEELLQEVPTEDRLKGVTAEDRLRDLDAEELSKLRKLLDEKLATK